MTIGNKLDQIIAKVRITGLATMVKVNELTEQSKENYRLSQLATTQLTIQSERLEKRLKSL
jgi:hypothetical protein